MKPKLHSKEAQAYIREFILKEAPELATSPDELDNAVNLYTQIMEFGFDMHNKGIIKGGIAGIVGCSAGILGAYTWKYYLKPKIEQYRLKRK